MNSNRVSLRSGGSPDQATLERGQQTGAPATTAYPVDKPSPQVVAGVSVSGDPYAPALATAGSRSTGVGTSEVSGSRSARPGAQRVFPKTKHRCRAILDAAVGCLDRALDHRDDFFLRNNALEQLGDFLRELWDLRAEREEPFAEIVNMLQLIFARRSVEDFTPEQLACLREVFDELQGEALYTDEFANAITTHLLQGGVDAFRGIE